MALFMLGIFPSFGGDLFLTDWQVTLIEVEEFT